MCGCFVDMPMVGGARVYEVRIIGPRAKLQTIITTLDMVEFDNVPIIVWYCIRLIYRFFIHSRVSDVIS